MLRKFLPFVLAFSSVLVACAEEETSKPTATGGSNSGATTGEESSGETDETTGSNGSTDKPSTPTKPTNNCKKAGSSCTVDFDCCSQSCGSQSETCN